MSLTESIGTTDKKFELMNQKEIIETENVELKNLIINLKDDCEEIKTKMSKKDDQLKNY